MSGRHPDAPVRRPVSLQRWEQLTFLHWRYAAAVVQRLLPPGPVVQEVDGSAWVALTPFRMAGVRAALTPAVPGWSTFPELNVRTYVTEPDGRDGLWFLRLVAPRRAVVVALGAVGLPYVRADAAQWADGDRWRYAFGPPATGGRAGGGGRLDAVVDARIGMMRPA